MSKKYSAYSCTTTAKPACDAPSELSSLPKMIEKHGKITPLSAAATTPTASIALSAGVAKRKRRE